MEIVKVVCVNDKLKVIPGDSKKKGFVRFPKHLRQEGKIFMVDTLKKTANKCWTTVGTIQEIQAVTIKKEKITKRSKKKVLPEWYIVVEYDGLPEFNFRDSLDYKIIKAAKKYKFKECGSGFGGMRDISFTFKGDNKEIEHSIKLFKKDLNKMRLKPKVTDYYIMEEDD